MAPPPLLGFNNNVRHRGRIFHIQTEDSGVKYPRIVTHLFADGGRIIKTTRTDYAEHVGRADMVPVVRNLMKEQHKAMFIALRAGELDPLLEQVSAPPKEKPASDRENRAAPPGPPPSVARPTASAEPHVQPEAAEAEEVAPESVEAEYIEAEPLVASKREPPPIEAPAASRVALPPSPPGSRKPPPVPSSLPKPAALPSNVVAGSRGRALSNPNLRKVRPSVVPSAPDSFNFDVESLPAANRHSQPPRTPSRRPAAAVAANAHYAPSRPAAIFGEAPPRNSLFGDGVISEKSLDEVILSYLAEDLEATEDE